VTALRGKEIDTFLARPDPARPVILLYGPDTGLVRERADALLSSAVADPNDPFSMVKMDGDELAGDPARLVDEAMTVPLFGGRRAIRIRAGSRNFASAIDTLAGMAPKDCMIVIEAGELRPDAPLRKACERSRSAVAIACYADTERDLARLIDEELRANGTTIAADARAALTGLLGGDRQASRNEIRKLALYTHGAKEVTLADVAAVVTDASALALDPIIDGAFAGRAAAVETAYAKALAAGTYPGQIIASAQRHAAQLHKARLALEEGRSEMDALESGFPRLHFSRRTHVETALRGLSSERLLRITSLLAEAAFDMRRQADLAGTIGGRALMSIAVNARARR